MTALMADGVRMSGVLCASVLFVASLGAYADVLHGRVAHVVDGYTLDVMVGSKRVRVRLLDIDAPEQKQPYGHCSRQSLIAICGGEAAYVEGSRHDRNGRFLANVRCNGVDARRRAGAARYGVGLRALRAGRVAAVCDGAGSSSRPAGSMGYGSGDVALGMAPALNGKQHGVQLSRHRQAPHRGGQRVALTSRVSTRAQATMQHRHLAEQGLGKRWQDNR